MYTLAFSGRGIHKYTSPPQLLKVYELLIGNVDWKASLHWEENCSTSQWSTEAGAEDRPSDSASAKMPKVTEELAEDLKLKFQLIIW